MIRDLTRAPGEDDAEGMSLPPVNEAAFHAYQVGSLYRNTFLRNDEGRRALGCLLRDLYYFATPVPPEGQKLRDFAQGLLVQMGICSGYDGIYGFIEKLAELPDERIPPIKEN